MPSMVNQKYYRQIIVMLMLFFPQLSPQCEASINEELTKMEDRGKWQILGIGYVMPQGTTNIMGVKFTVGEHEKEFVNLFIGAGSQSERGLSSSRDGSLLAYWRGRDSDSKLLIIRSDGSMVQRVNTANQSGDYTALSPDGSMLAYTVYESSKNKATNLYVFDIKNSRTILIDTHVSFIASQAWSADGRKVIYESYKNNGDRIQGSKEVLLADTVTSQVSKIVDGQRPSWSPDGAKIAYISSKGDYYIASNDGSHKQQLLSQTSFSDLLSGFFIFPAKVSGALLWSPDGRYVLFRKFREVVDRTTDTFYVKEIDSKKYLKVGKLTFSPSVWVWNRGRR